MAKVKSWLMDQQELVHEAIFMGLRDEEVVEYVKDNMQGRPIDKTFILEYISDGYKENERDENSA